MLSRDRLAQLNERAGHPLDPDQVGLLCRIVEWDQARAMPTFSVAEFRAATKAAEAPVDVQIVCDLAARRLGCLFAMRKPKGQMGRWSPRYFVLPSR